MAEHIKIGDISPRIQYTGDAVQVGFTYPFPIFVDGDIKVYVDGTLQTITTHYSVTGAGADTGGTVTFVAAPASGDIVTLIRDLSVERSSDFQESGEFRAKVINDELDKIIAMAQEADDGLTRTLHQTSTDAAGSLELPEKAARASKALGFDANGDPVVSTKTMSAMESEADNAAASAAAALASETSASTHNSNAQTAKTASETAQSLAEAARDAAQTAETNAETAETNAAASATAADVAKIEWQGAWVTTTVYAVADAVEEAGSSYVCIVAHTAGVFATDLSAAKWELMAQKGADGADGVDGADGADGAGSGTVTSVATSGLAGGGPITGTGTVDVPIASQAQAEVGTDNATAMTPLRANQAIVALADLIIQNSKSAAYTLVLSDAGKHILHPSADTTAQTFTIPANSSVAYPVGTALKITSTEWIISGSGLT